MRSLFILGFSLVTLAANQLSALAQTQQPTNAEIKRLRQELQKAITLSKKNNSTFIQDRRTSKEKQDRESFVRAWSKVEPGLAPFLGSWSSVNQPFQYIYPSTIKRRVCVIWIDEGSVGLKIASFSNGVIRVNDGEIFLKDGNYLTKAWLKNGKFQINDDITLSSPKPLEALTKLLVDIRETSETNKVNEQFKAAGCTASLPSR